MTTEEILEELRKTPPAIECFKNFEHNGITVELSNMDTVLIKPAGKNILLKDSRKNIQNCLDHMPAGKTLEGVPKEVWVKWMSVKI